MRWIDRLALGLRSLLRRERVERELDAELQFHLDQQIEESLAAGMSVEDARSSAWRSLGSLALVKEQCHDSLGLTLADELRQDVRYAARTLRRNPAFSSIALLTLAIGIGANTAIFSAVYAVLLRPLPYAQSDQLVELTTYIPQLRSKVPSLPVRAVDFQEFQRSNSVFNGISALVSADFNFTGLGQPERLYGARVSANFFSLLGVQPERGRGFLSEEDVEGRDHVVVISHELWTTRFGADPTVLNRVVSLDGQSYVVVGVMPAGFLFPTRKQLHPLVAFGPRVDIWKPMAFTQSELTSEGSWNWAVIARLKAGITVGVAQQEMGAISRSIVQRVRNQVPGFDFDIGVQLVPLSEIFRGNMRQELIMLMCAVGLLLLIACVNLTHLLLARVSTRNREFVMRVALGASHGRLVRQLLTESVAIASVGGTAGLLIAEWGLRFLLSLRPVDLPVIQPVLNGPVLWFGAVTTLFTGLACGLVPAFEIHRGHLQHRLKDGFSTMTPGTRAGHVRRTLVMVEVALSTGLLVVAGLLLHSFAKVMSVDKGFAVENILSIDLSVAGKQYPWPRTVAFYRDLLDRIRVIPGVTSAGAASALPLQHESDTTQAFYETDSVPRLDRPVAVSRSVTPGYFVTMGIPLLAGRFLEEQEPAPATVIGADLAQKLWSGAPFTAVVGHKIRQGDVKSAPVTIVGVVGDVRTGALDTEPLPVIYRPHTQSFSREMIVVARTAQEPEALAPAIRAPGVESGQRPSDPHDKDDEGSRVRLRRRTALPDALDRAIRRGGARPFGRRHLRSHHVYSRPSDTRNWRPHGVGRTALRCDEAGADAGTSTHPSRLSCRFNRGSDRRRVNSERSLRNWAARSNRPGGGVGHSFARRRACLLLTRPPCDDSRPVDCVTARVNKGQPLWFTITGAETRLLPVALYAALSRVHGYPFPVRTHRRRPERAPAPVSRATTADRESITRSELHRTALSESKPANRPQHAHATMVIARQKSFCSVQTTAVAASVVASAISPITIISGNGPIRTWVFGSKYDIRTPLIISCTVNR
jgi:predicted permease